MKALLIHNSLSLQETRDVPSPSTLQESKRLVAVVVNGDSALPSPTLTLVHSKRKVDTLMSAVRKLMKMANTLS